jgi:RNA polymerase sigma factor (sigma-70 family)
LRHSNLRVDCSRPPPKLTARRKTEVSGSGKKDEWRVTPETFEMLLAALDGSDHDAAGREYLRIRRNIVRFFEGRGFYDADAHADEVLDRVTKKLSLTQIQDIRQYVYGVARMLMLEIRKRRDKENRAAALMPESEFPQARMEEAAETESKLLCLNECLAKVDPDGREIILRYYHGEKRAKIENRKSLAESLGIPQNALRSRALRLRDRLEGCILSCLRKK